MQGVYKISCLQEDRVYIGSSTNIATRWKNHRNTLNRQAHKNVSLQLDWDAYGPDSFVFEILEVTDDTIAAEQRWIDSTEGLLYNVSRIAWNPMKDPATVKRHQEALNASGKRGSQKLQDADIIEIMQLLEQGITIKNIAEKYKVSIDTIYSIRSGDSWSRVTNKASKESTQKRIGDREITIIKQRVADNVATTKIAKELGVSQRTIRNWAIKLGIRKAK